MAGEASSRSRPSPPPRFAFTGFRFPAEVTVLAVLWYLRFGAVLMSSGSRRSGRLLVGRCRRRVSTRLVLDGESGGRSCPRRSAGNLHGDRLYTTPVDVTCSSRGGRLSRVRSSTEREHRLCATGSSVSTCDLLVCEEIKRCPWRPAWFWRPAQATSLVRHVPPSRPRGDTLRPVSSAPRPRLGGSTAAICGDVYATIRPAH